MRHSSSLLRCEHGTALPLSNASTSPSMMSIAPIDAEHVRSGLLARFLLAPTLDLFPSPLDAELMQNSCRLLCSRYCWATKLHAPSQQGDPLGAKTRSVSRASAEAHRDTVAEPVPSITTFLVDLLGARLTARLAGVDTSSISRWKSGAATPQETSEHRNTGLGQHTRWPGCCWRLGQTML